MADIPITPVRQDTFKLSSKGIPPPDATQAFLDANAAGVKTDMPYDPWRGNLYPTVDNFPLDEKTDAIYADEDIGRYMEDSSNTSKMTINDPSYLGFRVRFDFVNSSLLRDTLGNENHDTSSNVKSINSAVDYFNRTDPNRAKSLMIFGKRLNFIQNYMPWYFQTIEGLGRAWQAHQNFKDPFRGGDDAKIKINTLESVDLTITGLMDLYRMTIYDHNYTRDILPNNLEKFNVYIYVKDIRTFRKFSNNDTRLTRDSAPGIPIGYTQPYFTFQFRDCMFTPEDDGAIFDNVTNVNNDFVAGSISFSYKDIEMQSGNYTWTDFDITQYKDEITFSQADQHSKNKKFTFKGAWTELTEEVSDDWQKLKAQTKKELPGLLNKLRGLIPNYLGNVYNITGLIFNLPELINNGITQLDNGTLVSNLVDRGIQAGQTAIQGAIFGQKRNNTDENGIPLDIPDGSKSFVQINERINEFENDITAREKLTRPLETMPRLFPDGTPNHGIIQREDIMTPDNTNSYETIINKKDSTFIRGIAEPNEVEHIDILTPNNTESFNKLGKIDILTPNNTPSYRIISGHPNVYVPATPTPITLIKQNTITTSNQNQA